MKVLHIVGVSFKLGNGITVITDDLVKALISHNIDSEILLLNKTNLIVPYKVHDEISDYKLFFKNNIFDLVVFHGLFFKEYALIGNILKSINIPYLIKPHSSLMKAAQKKSYLKKKLAFIFLLNSFIKKSHAILFSNEEERNNSIYKNHKYYIEPNGVTIDLNLGIQRNINPKIKLLFLSRFDFKHKGIDFLIKGYKKFLSITNESITTLDIYGIGSNREIRKLKKSIKNIPSITLNGPVFGEEKKKLLDQSDILVLTSRYEGFPTIFIDVLLRGIPVIVTPGTNAAYFKNSGVGWLAELSSSSIAETIELAVNDYISNKKEISLNCICFAKNNFDIKKNILQTISIYKKVLNQ